MCTEFLRLSGKTESWDGKMDRNKGMAGSSPAKNTAQNQTEVDNGHTSQQFTVQAACFVNILAPTSYATLSKLFNLTVLQFLICEINLK